ncbi:MAG: UDP-3-O-(3-hydroxymyristoyl)glucosamine N-acyltransferase [Phycisphaerae bacterium]|nr:UDP-3-O-(3-hydroxymyristoyl)glucosamine N-acyltransferase [Phycisphaerae bacterium]
MAATLAELASAMKQYGMQPAIRGDAGLSIRRVATLEDAVEGDVSFLSNPKYEKALHTTKASAVVLKPEIEAPEHLNLIRVADPYAAITLLIVKLHGYRQHRRIAPDNTRSNIAPTARIGENASIAPGVTIDDDAVIGDNAVIYPGCYIGPRCRIGNNPILYPNVVIYDDCVLGNNVAIHAGTSIGNDGLGYAPVGEQWIKIPQIGIVEIGNDVEIGANCAIDRATLGKTVIGSGTKMSNLIAVGHGAQIGENCMIVAQVGLAGSVNVGKHVTMAGQAGIVGHIRIGDNATIGAKAGVTSNVADGETVLGQPAIPIRDMRRQIACMQRLPSLVSTIKNLEKRLAELEQK